VVLSGAVTVGLILWRWPMRSALFLRLCVAAGVVLPGAVTVGLILL
jgi:hypothetical protein